MAKRRNVLLGFSALLVLGVLSLILTYTELTAIYSEDDMMMREPSHRKITAEWQREDKDLVRARQNTLAEGQPAAGLNVGRVLAKFDSDEKSQDDAANAPVPSLSQPLRSDVQAGNRQPRETNTKTADVDVDWQKRQLNEQILYQRQLAMQLNWTARVISSSSHFRDAQGRLNTLAHLKSTELRLDTSTKELWSYLRDQLKTINFTKAATAPEVVKTKLLHSVKEQLDLLSLHAIQIHSIVDSYINEGWRETISKELAQLMQRRLHHLQNPKNCHRAKKLLCRVSKPCGFGCQMHHVAYCFIFAYATERMLLLDPSGWRYSGRWETIFQPLSSTPNCTLQRGIYSP